MTTARLSDKGQITIPAGLRAKFGLKGKSRVSITVRDDEIVIKPVKSLADLYGSLHRYAKGKSSEMETTRSEAERIAAEETTGEGLNW